MSGWPLESNGRPYSGVARGGAAGASHSRTVYILGLNTVRSYICRFPQGEPWLTQASASWPLWPARDGPEMAVEADFLDAIDRHQVAAAPRGFTTATACPQPRVRQHVQHARSALHTAHGPGGLGGESTAGTSASEAIMRSRMPCANDSFHDSHVYTPLGRSRRLVSRGQQVNNSTRRSSFAASLSRHSPRRAAARTGGRRGSCHLRTQARSHPQLAPSPAPPTPALYLYAGHESQDCCPPAYAGGALVSTFHLERAVSSPSASGPPRSRSVRKGGAAAHSALSSMCSQQDRARYPRRSGTSPGCSASFSF